MTAATATAAHVAGPVEREQADTKAGWRWAQRCLRCDMSLLHRPPTSREKQVVGTAKTGAKAGELVEVQLGQTFAGGFYKLGAAVYEREDGTLDTELCGEDGEPAECRPQ